MSYHDELAALAKAIGSDGCTAPALQIHVDCCWEHDYAYVMGTTPRGVPITREQADQRFLDCNRALSPLKWLSPVAMVRYWAVSTFGRRYYRYRPPTAEVLTLLADSMSTIAPTAIADAQAARVALTKGTT